jgi:hypothetical protein
VTIRWPIRSKATLQVVSTFSQSESKMVVPGDPERSVLTVREHRKRAEPPFAGRYGLNGEIT